MRLVPLDDRGDGGATDAPVSVDHTAKKKFKLTPVDAPPVKKPKDTYLSESLGALKTGAKEFAEGAVETVKGMGRDYMTEAAQHPGFMNMAQPIYSAGAALRGLASSPAAEFAESAVLGAGGVEAGPSHNMRLKDEPVAPNRVATALRSDRAPPTPPSSKTEPLEAVARPPSKGVELPPSREGATPPSAPAAAPKLKLTPLGEAKPEAETPQFSIIKNKDYKSTMFPGADQFSVKDANGKHVVNVIANREGNKIQVHAIGGKEGEMSLKNTMGTTAMRKILPELQKQYPGATSIGGTRITGSRARGVGKGNISSKTTEVTLPSGTRAATADRHLRPSAPGGVAGPEAPPAPAVLRNEAVPSPRQSAPGAGGVARSQSAGAAARPPVGPTKVTRPMVMGLETRLYDLQGRKQIAVLDAKKAMERRPPEMLPSEERLFRHGEGDPGVVLTPREQQLFDEHIAPIREANEELRKTSLQLGRKLHLTDEEVEGLHQGDPSHYMPRFNKDYMHDLKGLTEEEVHDPLMPPSLHGGRGTFEAPSQKTRTYYTMENAAGQKELVHVEHGGFRHIIDKENKGKFIPVGKGNKPGPGIKVSHDGQEWTIKEAHTSEIEPKVDHSYVKHATASTQLNNIYLTRQAEELAFAHNIKAELQDEKLATTDRDFARKKGFRQVSFPGLANTYVEPRIARALDKFSPYKRGDDFSEWLAGANRFLTGTMFGTPIPHVRNIAELYFQDRAFAWTNPKAYPRMKESIKDAYKAVTTQNKLYQDIMTHGGSMMAARDYGREFFDQAAKEVLKLEGAPQTRSVAMKLAMAPKEFVQAWWAASHKALFKFQDIMTVARVRERMLEQGLKTPEAINAAMRGIVEETHQGMPPYRLPVELPHPDWAATLGGKTFNTASAAALPPAFFTSPFGRMAANFTRYNYGLATATFGPPVRALRESARAVKYASTGNPQAAKKAFADATNAVLMTAAQLLVYNAALPVLDKGVQEWTGDKRSRMSRWGSMAVVQALDDVMHGRGTNWDTARLLIFSPSPMLSMGVDIGSYILGKQEYGKPVTMGQTAGKIAGDIPIVSQFQRPAGSDHPVREGTAEQLVGVGHRPMTLEEHKEARKKAHAKRKHAA